MRGLIFSLDMVFATIAVIALIALIGFTLQQNPRLQSATDILTVHAKDAAMMRLYGDFSNPVPLSQVEQQCMYSFKPLNSTSILNPSIAANWTFSLECVVRP